MSQRLGIAAALLGDPPVLMLDEPVNGLDPEGVVWIRTLLRTLAAEGRTVLLSSHLMSEMAMTADRLVIIGRGRLIAQATMADFLAAGSGGFGDGPLTAGRRARRAADRARRHRHPAGRRHPGRHRHHPRGRSASSPARTGSPCTGLSAHQATLEDRYMELTRDAADYRAAPGEPAATRK